MNDNNCREAPKTPEMTINNLIEENSKLQEEIKYLNDSLIKYTNLIEHIKYSVNLAANQIKHDIWKQY